MAQKQVQVDKIVISNQKPFVLIAGPCVIESRQHAMKMAKSIKAVAQKLKIPYIFKASYDKANRTSVSSFRGPGLEEGLDILAEIKQKLKVPVLSDVHNDYEVEPAAAVLDVLQIPAFLSRQTDLLVAAGESGKVVNIKKGQFLAPWDMRPAIDKVLSTGNKKILLTDRGTSFGYNTLVSDFRSLAIMSDYGFPVVFDATHSVQQPGGKGSSSGGQREFVPVLSRAALAVGCAALFMEVHDKPDQAKSDGPNMVPLSQLEKLLVQFKKIDQVIKG